MCFGWDVGGEGEWLVAAARATSGVVYYVGLAVVVAIMVVTIIVFYRTWAEVNEDLEPDSPQDLLDSFREAHAAGEIDDRELDRVRSLLSSGAATEGPSPRGTSRRDASLAGDVPPDPDTPTSA